MTIAHLGLDSLDVSLARSHGLDLVDHSKHRCSCLSCMSRDVEGGEAAGAVVKGMERLSTELLLEKTLQHTERLGCSHHNQNKDTHTTMMQLTSSASRSGIAQTKIRFVVVCVASLGDTALERRGVGQWIGCGLRSRRHLLQMDFNDRVRGHSFGEFLGSADVLVDETLQLCVGDAGGGHHHVVCHEVLCAELNHVIEADGFHMLDIFGDAQGSRFAVSGLVQQLPSKLHTINCQSAVNVPP